MTTRVERPQAIGRTQTSPKQPSAPRAMPDVAQSRLGEHKGTLDWVGMSSIALPIQLEDDREHTRPVNAHAQVYVNLNNQDVKGIHMSRLYLALTHFAQDQRVSADSLQTFLKDILTSHEEISDQARLDLSFDYLIKQPALKSGYSGWKAYPARISANISEHQVQLEMGVEVPYSSTCPCSAALARQLLQEAFSADFKDQTNISRDAVEQWLTSAKGSSATPHSQRSAAKVVVKLSPDQSVFDIHTIVNQIETTLATPVQTAVKREDEQEFARLNGANMMFCEDAARRLKALLNQLNYPDFWLKVEHYESLHAHDAVAVATKGVPNGYAQNLFFF